MRALGRSKTRFGDIRMASARFECRRKKHRKGAKNDLQNGPQKHAKGDRRRPRSSGERPGGTSTRLGGPREPPGVRKGGSRKRPRKWTPQKSVCWSPEGPGTEPARDADHVFRAARRNARCHRGGKEGINPSGLVKYLGQNLKILEFWILEIWDLEEFERTCALYLARRDPCKQGAADRSAHSAGP